MDHTIPRSRCEQLAQRLEEDIRTRRLECGQRYLSAESAARQLGVSRMSAHRAMGLLVEREFLVRKRGRGTFVGPAAPKPNGHDTKTAVTHVHL